MVLYPGCNALTLPHLLDASFLQDVVISGDFDLCCGEMYFHMGLFDVVREAARTGADEPAVYCGGCQLTLSLMRWLYPTRQPVRHLLEYLKEATGEPVADPAPRRALRMSGNITVKALPKMLSPRTFRIRLR